MNQNVILRKLTRNVLPAISASMPSFPRALIPQIQALRRRKVLERQTPPNAWQILRAVSQCDLTICLKGHVEATVDLFHAIIMNRIEAFKLEKSQLVFWSALSFPFIYMWRLSWNEHIGCVWCTCHQLCPSTSTITQETSTSSATSTKHLGPTCSGLGASCSSPGV